MFTKMTVFAHGKNENGIDSTLSFCADSSDCGQGPKIIATISGKCRKGICCTAGPIFTKETVDKDVRFSFTLHNIGSFIEGIERILDPRGKTESESVFLTNGSCSLDKVHKEGALPGYRIAIVEGKYGDDAAFGNTITLTRGQVVCMREMFKNSLPALCLDI